MDSPLGSWEDHGRLFLFLTSRFETLIHGHGLPESRDARAVGVQGDADGCIDGLVRWTSSSARLKGYWPLRLRNDPVG